MKNAGIISKREVQIKQQFFNSLKRGTGQAYLIAKNNPKIDFSAYIIKGALRNYAYDAQAEGSRAHYVFDLIILSTKKEQIRKAILKRLAAEQKDTWTLTQLFELTKLFAQQGDAIARQAIYDRFLNNPIEGSDWAGYEEILELDGLKGLIYIAEKFGKHLKENPDDWQDDTIIRQFQNDNPNVNAFYELEKISKTNTFIRLYLECIKRTEENRKNHVRETQTHKDIIDEILNSKPFLSFKRRKELNVTELNKIAEKLLVEKNKANIEKLLNVFTIHKFPLNSAFILNLAKQQERSKYRIHEYAIGSLKFLKSDAIRQFALDRIPKAKRPESLIDILSSNYKNGDHKLLTDIANNAKSEHLIEGLAGSYVNIFKINKTKDCKKPLEVLYDKMNCGIHRHSIIEILIENEVLSDRIKKEIKYDSYLETRKLMP